MGALLVCRCTVCRRKNTSYISRHTPVNSVAYELRRGHDRFAPAHYEPRPPPPPQYEQHSPPRRTYNAWGSRNRYPRE